MRSPRDSSRTLTLSLSRTASSSVISCTVRSRVSSWNAVNFRVQIERLPRGQIPPKLILLSEQQRELPPVTILPFPREHSPGPGRSRWWDRAGRRAFSTSWFCPAPFGPRNPTSSPGSTWKADIFDGDGLLVLAAEKTFNGATKARLLFIRPERLGQAIDFDGRHLENVRKK